VKTKLTIAALAITIAFQFRLRSQSPASVWDGAYTADQAKQGDPLYAKECAGCHGDAMEGVGQTPQLAGDDFKANWNGQNVDDLFEKIRSTMPAGNPGKLSRDENIAVVAFILKSNGYPAGAKLSADAEARQKIKIEPAKPK